MYRAVGESLRDDDSEPVLTTVSPRFIQVLERISGDSPIVDPRNRRRMSRWERAFAERHVAESVRRRQDRVTDRLLVVSREGTGSPLVRAAPDRPDALDVVEAEITRHTIWTNQFTQIAGWRCR